MNTDRAINYNELRDKIICWGQELGFSQVGISDVDLSSEEKHLTDWLDNNYHGSMDYMQRHGMMRARPAELVPGTIRVISVRMDYLPEDTKFLSTLQNGQLAYISRYALGRDYHKLMRKRLQQLAKMINAHCEDFNFRPFVDSAPILERPLAAKAGLGWVGKHSLLLNKEASSWFFIGELLVDIPLPVSETPSEESSNGCGKCLACINICPTKAIVEPYQVDARRCISYLTIESDNPIPVELRPLMGNRIYGCDDCQLICPWNQYAQAGNEYDFKPRNNLDHITLLELFDWDEQQFLTLLEGSPIRRIGFQRWQRNIAVALGNAPYDEQIVDSLSQKLSQASDMVKEHIQWAISQQELRKSNLLIDKNQKLTKRLLHTIDKVFLLDR